MVVVRPVEDGWRVLLLRVYGYWDCPKGEVEPGEDLLTAALREVREETTIGDLEFRWGDEFVETPPYSKNKVARYYVAETRTTDIKLPVEPQLGAPEHHEFRWLAFDAAKALAVPRVRAAPQWAHDRVAAP